MAIAEQVRRVQNEIAEAAIRRGRAPEEVTLVAVTKTRSVDEVAEVIEAGVTHLGENRVQEAASKIPALNPESVVWHLIGHLQSNKAKQAVPLFSWIDSLDSRKIIGTINRKALQDEKTLNVLIQVNVSGEVSKSGIPPEDAKDLVLYAAACEGVAVQGLMTIGSLGASESQTRDEFKRMKALFDHLAEDERIGASMRVLSMGMSGDYVTAVEEGATMVRVGSSIFGIRR